MRCALRPRARVVPVMQRIDAHRSGRKKTPRTSVTWLVACALGAALGCGGTTPEPQQAGTEKATPGGEIDLTKPDDERGNPFEGLVPCKDEPSALGNGCKAESKKPSEPAEAKPAETAEPAPDEEGAPATSARYNVPIEPHNPQRGPKDALVTLVVFSDFECPYCKAVEEVFDKLLTVHKKDVRLVWKDNPLSIHLKSDTAALFARSAQSQKGDRYFWRAHDKLFAKQPHFENRDLAEIAFSIGIEWYIAKRDIDKQNNGDSLYFDMKLAGSLGVKVTPTTFVNGRKIEGAQPYSVFEQVVGEELAVAQQAVESGVKRENVYEHLVQGGVSAAGPDAKRSQVE